MGATNRAFWQAYVIRPSLILVALALLGQSARAVEQVDQQQTDGVNAVVASLPIGQTFTPTANNLSSFTFFFRPITANFDFRIIHWSDQSQIGQIFFNKTNAAQG